MSDVEMVETVTPVPVTTLAADCASIAFSPDGTTFGTSGGDRYDTTTWEPLPSVGNGPPARDWRDSMELGPNGEALVSTCQPRGGNSYLCAGDTTPFPKFSPDGNWVVAGATLRHRRTGETRVLDPTALVGIFAPNGDVIAAGADNSLTRYCRSQ
jgi:hypothetical protein